MRRPTRSCRTKRPGLVPVSAQSLTQAPRPDPAGRHFRPLSPWRTLRVSRGDSPSSRTTATSISSRLNWTCSSGPRRRPSSYAKWRRRPTWMTRWPPTGTTSLILSSRWRPGRTIGGTFCTRPGFCLVLAVQPRPCGWPPGSSWATAATSLCLPTTWVALASAAVSAAKAGPPLPTLAAATFV